MKRKIIAIVISVVIVAGTGTAVGVVVKQNNDAKTEELVSVAVSEALATTETTTENSTSESATTENTATTESTTTEPAAVSASAKPSVKTTNKPTAKTTTKAKSKVTSKTKTTVKEISTTNAPAEIDPDDIPEEVRTPVGTVVKIPKNKKQDKYGYYWPTSYTYDSDLNPHSYTYCIDENNQLFYHDDNGNRIYYKE